MPDLWNMHCAIAPEEVDGETINDAIYNRNAKVEAKMNYKLKEVNGEYDKMATELDTLVMSGDSTYDAVYMPMFTAGSGMSQGYYRELDEIDTIHLGEEWWDQIFLDATSIGGSHYFAMSNAHLMGWDGLWCLLFNENMMDDLGLDYPYQLVRDGKWTLDKLTEYCEAARRRLIQVQRTRELHVRVRILPPRPDEVPLRARRGLRHKGQERYAGI